MSFLRKLFGLGGAGLGGAAATPAQESPAEEYKGYRIQATPYEEQGAFQLCGVISKEADGETKEHRFVRADRFPSLEIAKSMTLSKARQIIDLQQEQMFSRQ